MKSCPTCKRTFDDNFTFCLVDGSILDAPGGENATLTIPKPKQTEPPSTVLLHPKEESVEEISHTTGNSQKTRKPEELVSTIAAPLPKVELATGLPALVQPGRKSNRSPLIMGGVGVLFIIGLFYFIAINRTGNTGKDASKANAATTPSASPAVVASANSNQPRMAATPSPTPSSSPVVNLEGTTWEGTQNGEYPRIFEFETGGRVIQRAGAPGSNKASMNSKVGSWTQQENRVTMKFPTTKSDIAEEIEAIIQGDEMTGPEKWKDRPNLHDSISVRITR